MVAGMIDGAVIAGQLGRALLWRGAQPWLLRTGGGVALDRPRPDELALMRDCGAELLLLDGPGLTVDRVAARLAREAAGHAALGAVLATLDADLAPDTRREAAKEAEQALADRQVHAFTANRLLGIIFPAEDADLPGARAATAGGTPVHAAVIYRNYGSLSSGSLSTDSINGAANERYKPGRLAWPRFVNRGPPPGAGRAHGRSAKMGTLDDHSLRTLEISLLLQGAR